MPIIRYDIGDVGVSSDKVCPCGRGLPLLAALTGRTTDAIITRSGKSVPGVALPWQFMASLGVEQFQIVQQSYEEVMVRLVMGGKYFANRAEELTREIIRRYRPIFGEDMEITVDFVDDIPPTRGGKRRIVVSNLTPGKE